MSLEPQSRLHVREAKLKSKGYHTVYTSLSLSRSWCVMVREPFTVHVLAETASGEFFERDIPISSKATKRHERRSICVKNA